MSFRRVSSMMDCSYSALACRSVTEFQKSLTAICRPLAMELPRGLPSEHEQQQGADTYRNERSSSTRNLIDHSLDLLGRSGREPHLSGSLFDRARGLGFDHAHRPSQGVSNDLGRRQPVRKREPQPTESRGLPIEHATSRGAWSQFVHARYLRAFGFGEKASRSARAIPTTAAGFIFEDGAATPASLG